MVDVLADSSGDLAPGGGASAGPRSAADRTLRASAALWFLVAVAGQWIFVTYILGYYGPLILEGGLEALAQTHLPKGFIPGDTLGNLAVGIHLVLAAIITVGGPLQIVLGAIVTGGGPRRLSSEFRTRARPVHRWNGRLYMTTAFIISIGGLYMVLTRGILGGPAQQVSISLNAVLIMVCAGAALRHALAGDFATHRRWALRLFLVVSGVWFFRVGLMAWIFINQGPVGFDPVSFTGPFLNFLGFAQYLLPLAVLEIYLRVQERAGAPGKYAMAGGLIGLTVLMGFGIFAATMGMWLPRL